MSTVVGRLLAVGVASPAPIRLPLGDCAFSDRLRQLVDGWIERVPLTAPGDDGVQLVAYVNEEGIPRGLPFNRAVGHASTGRWHDLYGQVVIVREVIDHDGEHYFDVTPEDDARVARMTVEGATLREQAAATAEDLL